MEGHTLDLYLREARPWKATTVARLGSVLCEALAASHAEGVVHRDVKPSNVMITKTSPGLKLLDFGISKLFEAELHGHTSTGVMMGRWQTSSKAYAITESVRHQMQCLLTAFLCVGNKLEDAMLQHYRVGPVEINQVLLNMN